MSMRYQYAIFWTDPARGAVWARALNRRQALRAARVGHGEVYAMRYPGAAADHGWDAPTFRVCSDRIADYRQATA